MLKGKKIVLGITGSIAAYKAAILVRLLVKAGAEVQVVMTPAAKDGCLSCFGKKDTKEAAIGEALMPRSRASNTPP